MSFIIYAIKADFGIGEDRWFIVIVFKLDRDFEPFGDFLTISAGLGELLFIQFFGTIPIMSVADWKTPYLRW